MRRSASWVALIVAMAFVVCTLSVASADLPSGTDVYATLQQTLDTKSSKVGDPVTMTVTAVSPETAPDAAALQGAMIRGHVAQVYGATPTKKAYVGIAFDTITLADGRTYPFPAKITALQKKKRINIAQAAGEVLAGMVVGNIIGKGIGTPAGGAIGAMGGVVYASQMSQNFRIPQGSTVKMRTIDVLTMGPPRPQAPMQQAPTPH